MIEVVEYSESLRQSWNDCVHRSINGTFLHTREFIEQRARQTVDASLVVFKGSSVVGLLPAAHTSEWRDVVESHPRSTYGGLVRSGNLHYHEIETALSRAVGIFEQMGYREFTYRAIPFPYHKRLCEEDELVLTNLGARITRTALSSVIDLRRGFQLSPRRRRSLRRAQALTVQLLPDNETHEFHSILAENLSTRHSTYPVHSAEELHYLRNTWPENVEVLTATDTASICAGVLLFKTETCWHAQYIASNAHGREMAAIDRIIFEVATRATSAGIPFLSLGTSNDPKTGTVNEGLFEFKRGFGSGAVIQRAYSLELALKDN